jgi:hypothetical protein
MNLSARGCQNRWQELTLLDCPPQASQFIIFIPALQHLTSSSPYASGISIKAPSKSLRFYADLDYWWIKRCLMRSIAKRAQFIH